MREIIVSATVLDKLSDLVSYLKNDIRLSEDAAQAYRKRFIAYLQTFGAEVDHPLCRFRRWCKLGYRCAVFEKHWVLAYEVTDEGVIVQDMSHTAMLDDIAE